MKLLTAAQMTALDRRTINEIGIPGAVLMENAGRSVAQEVERRFSNLCPGPVLVVAGKGNNGGDGFVIARYLRNRGWRVRVLALAAAEQIAGDAAVHMAAWCNMGGSVTFAPDAAALEIALAAEEPDALIIDALFGTGLSSAIRGHYAQAVTWMNAHQAPVVAVDIPSGVDASDGTIEGPCVKAALTVTFAYAKVGQATYPGAAQVGELVVTDIGIPPDLPLPEGDDCRLVDAALAGSLLPVRATNGHKGTFGHLLVVAGSTGKSGAAAMAAVGGLRSGSGLVTVGCPTGVHAALAIKLTEAMTLPLAEKDGALGREAAEKIKGQWQQFKALALGPGLGIGAETQECVRDLVQDCPLPVVLDADGLNAFAGAPEPLLDRPAGSTILTPHPGEMARLIGRSIAEVEADRLTIARKFASAYGIVLVLKGARTLIALPDGAVRINSSGNAGLASGGTGDVLTGVIGGLLAQGLDAADAAILGVYLHGVAADRLALRMGNAGMLASDLLRELAPARLQLSKGEDHAAS